MEIEKQIRHISKIISHFLRRKKKLKNLDTSSIARPMVCAAQATFFYLVHSHQSLQ
jgi:hypothetical protein